LTTASGTDRVRDALRLKRHTRIDDIKTMASSFADDDGLTIVEAVVALVIIFGAVLVMLRGIDSDARVLSETKRVSAASALASELMERARSLEWANMGLTVDANSTNCAEPASPSDPPQGVGCSLFTTDFPSEISSTAGGYAFGGEPVVFATGTTFDPFLSFHQQVVRDSTTFDRYLFITSVRTDPEDPGTEKYRRITAVVRWNAQSGYRREVRLASYVGPFTEPSQPFISAEVTDDGGFGQVRGRVTGIAGWGLAHDATQDESILVSLPSSRVTATSDYVSSGEVRLEGTSAYWTQAGPDQVLGSTSSDDVALTSVDPEVVDLLADDDGTSSAPLTLPITAEIDLARLTASEGGTTIEEDAGPTVKNHVTVLTPGGASAVDPGDGLPHASISIQAAGRVTISRLEDWSGAPAQAYEDASDPLGQTAYTFTFYRYGDRDQKSSLAWSGVVDRQDEVTTKQRKAGVQFDWAGEEIDLLDDEVISSEHATFRGWVVINLPALTNGGAAAPLEAGEYYAALTPGIAVKNGDVVIDVWNGSSYTTVFDGYDGIPNCGSESPIPIDAEATTSDSGVPHLHYLVSGSLSVNGMCVGATQQYASGEVRSNTVSAANLVTGEVSYQVIDEVGADSLGNPDLSTLYDLTVSFSGGGVQATAVYVNPELS
jgi:hypothetical protein